jgi:hypothetical protein
MLFHDRTAAHPNLRIWRWRARGVICEKQIASWLSTRRLEKVRHFLIRVIPPGVFTSRGQVIELSETRLIREAESLFGLWPPIDPTA